MATVEVSLTVPQDRENCITWLKSQAPSVVADYLQASERYYASVADVVFPGETTALRLLREENARIQQEMEAKERTAVARAAEMRKQFEARHKIDVQECKATSESLYATTVTELQTQIKSLRDALAEQRASEDAKVAMATREAEEGMRKRAEEHESNRRAWEEKLERLQEDKLALSKEYAERLEKCVRPFAGTPNEIGNIGETMVEDFQRTLELGTMENVSRCRVTGYADHTWSYNGAVTLVEDKNKDELEPEKDLNKFRNDVRVAAGLGRIHMAMFLSLRRRVAGRPIFSLEMLCGVPTLWASRDPSDPISAETMVKTAFRIMAELWPLIRDSTSDLERGDGNATLRRVSHFLATTMANHDLTQQIIRSLEATGQKMMRQITRLKRQNELLIADVQDLRACDARLDREESSGEEEEQGKNNEEEMTDVTPEFWETAHGRALEAAVVAYHKAHQGRYPKRLEDVELDKDAMQSLTNIRDVMKEVVARKKASILKERGAKKRRVE